MPVCMSVCVRVFCELRKDISWMKLLHRAQMFHICGEEQSSNSEGRCSKPWMDCRLVLLNIVYRAKFT